MGKNKYYTPEIEEFHPGFEYYDADVLTTLDEKVEIYIAGIQDSINMGLIKVKYLDREDIESLGFTEGERPDGFGYAGEYYVIKNAEYKKPTRTEVDELHLIHQPITNWILIWQIMKLNIGDHHNVRFSGTIKNKSELKRLLKQIGINEVDKEKKGEDSQ